MIPVRANAKDNYAYDLNTEIFSFFLTNKIMNDGSIQEGGLGINYSDAFSGELRIRHTKTEMNEEFGGLEDSLNAASSDIYEVFFLPLKYHLINTQSVKTWLGIGGYYYDEKLNEKGFFNMPELGNIGLEPVNSYKNEFSMRTLGPILDAGVTYRDSNWVNVTLSVGVVPIFATWTKQKTSIVPLMSHDSADNSQNHWGSPYLYCDLNWMLSLPKLNATPSDWKIALSILFDYSRLQFKDSDFTYDSTRFNWYFPEREVVTRSFKLEAALLIPLGEMYLQIGLGRIFDSIKVDSGAAIRSDKNYFNIAARVIQF